MLKWPGLLSFRAGYLVPLCAVMLSFFTLSACKKDDKPTLQPLDLLYKAPPETGLEVNFCTNKSEQLTTKLKYIFVLDQSTSNQRNYLIDQVTGKPAVDGTGALIVQDALGTDPDGSRRYTPLIDFLDKSPAVDPLRYYSLITFTDNITNNTAFTNNRDSFKAIVNTERTKLADNGSTNYEGALDAVYQKINSDIAAARANPTEKIASTYIVVFVSDGFPILSISQNPLVVNAQNRESILGKVRGIVSLQSENLFVDSINFFTGYYYVDGNTDQRAQDLLKDMSELVGNGIAFNFGTGKNVDFSYFTVPSKTLQYQLADIFVSNRSATWWDDGRFLQDTDGDGLPDEMEITMGSDTKVIDSDGNGVSDLIEYRLRGTPCAQATCTVTGAYPFKATAPTSGGCSTATGLISLPGGRISYKDSDADGLNDCEELVLNNPTGINEFDSNNDQIPDGLAFLMGLDFASNTNTAAQSKFEDGYTNYQKVKMGLPTSLSYNQFLNPNPYNYNLTVTKSDTDETCYKLKVENFSTLGAGNLVHVDFLQTTPLLSTRRVYKTAEKRFDGTSPFLRIGDQHTESAVWK